MIGRRMQILVAEDDRDIAILIAHYVTRAGWVPHVVASGDAALAFARQRAGGRGHPRRDAARPERPRRLPRASRRPDDLGASHHHGHGANRRARPHQGARRRRRRLRRQAVQPQRAGRARARAGAPVKRNEPEPSKTLSVGALSLDLDTHIVSVDGQPVNLAAKEFMLLQYLMQHRGRVLSRDVLLRDVWGYQYTGGTRTVDVHVRRLREKIPLLVDALVTVKQFGYKLESR